VEDEAADVNADGVEIPDGGADVKEKADRRRNMADGLSFESLRSASKVDDHCADDGHTYMPSTCEPFPGQ
jgi:hypothetical protein